jgi:hypothetical protein
MYDIEMSQPSEEFARCWNDAGSHIQAHMQGSGQFWLKSNLEPPFLEHLSFRLGNQLFFVRLEDVDGRMMVPGSRVGLRAVSEGCRGHACLMPMRRTPGGWVPTQREWGLVDLDSGATVNPAALVSDELIEMTDWELQDLAVQVVRDHIKGTGRQLMSWQGNPAVTPSLWFVGDRGPEWVVVRAARYPLLEAPAPADWKAIAASCARLSKVGHFASVAVASSADEFDAAGGIPPTPLWRGHQMFIRFTGLVDFEG